MNIVSASGKKPLNIDSMTTTTLNHFANQVDQNDTIASFQVVSGIKSILVPFDFSRVAKVALAFAIDVASRSGIDLHILHVVELPVVHNSVIVPVLGYEQALKEDLRDDSAKRMLELMRDLDGKPVNATTRVVFGSVAHEILRYAEQANIDIIIAGAHGSSGIRELLVGSNIKRIIRKSRTPVLILKHSSHLNISNIVLTTELNGGVSEFIINRIEDLLNLFGATLHILHVRTGPETEEEHALELLNEFRDKFSHNHVTVNLINHFSIEEGIDTFARSVNAEIICLGTHGRKGFSRLLHGSITGALVNHSDRMIWTSSMTHGLIKMNSATNSATNSASRIIDGSSLYD